MPIKFIGRYKPTTPVKPYAGLNLKPEIIAELDKLHATVLASKDQFNLRQVNKSPSEIDSGIVILTDGDFTLFFTLEYSKSIFFYAFCTSSFGLKNPEPGQYWSCSSGVWVHLDSSEERRLYLWQTYSSRYLEKNDSPPPPPKKQKSEGDDSSSSSTRSYSKNSSPTLTPDILKQLGFIDGPTT